MRGNAVARTNAVLREPSVACGLRAPLLKRCFAWVVVPRRAAQCPAMLQFRHTGKHPSAFLKGVTDLQKCKWHCKAESHCDFYLAGAAWLGCFPAQALVLLSSV